MITVRCSSLDRILACPGSMALTARVAPSSGAAAEEGTFLHWSAHDRMKRELGARGELGAQPHRPKSVDFSQWVADYYYRTVSDTVPEGYALEVEVELVYDFARFTLSGHIDALAVSPDGKEAIGFDLKTGYDPVDSADNNEQLFGYICCLLMAYPPLEHVTFYIVQPRNNEDDGYERVSKVEILGIQNNAAIAGFEARVNAALDDDRSLVTGVKQCKWCAAASQCPAMLAERDLMKIKLTDEALATVKDHPDDTQLADWTVASKILTRPMGEATDMAKDRIKEVGSLTASDGTVITTKVGPGSYSYPDPVAFFKALRVVVPRDDDLARCVSYSMTKTRDVVAEVNQIPKTSKKGMSAQTILDGHLKPLTEQGERVTLQFTS